jgi:hypothetical protein
VDASMMNRARVPDRVIAADRTADPDPGTDVEPAAPVEAPLNVLPPLTGVAELFHQLNNQLGIILANAELLELKAGDETSRARAAQVVSSVLEALATARTLRQRLEP